MLRNHNKCQQLITNLNSVKLHHRSFYLQTNVLHNKSTNASRQSKVMGKLFGNRISGSKKRWFPFTDSSSSQSHIIFKQSQFGKVSNNVGKNSSRRMAVLNKLFMQHITDLLATGEISETILGKGLQVSRVKISQDFAYINVFWLCNGEPIEDALLEQELQRCSGLLRHALTQLGLMGVVPRIKFVKDKFYSNMNQVEALLRNMDFGAEEENGEELDSIGKNMSETLKHEFYGRKITIGNQLATEDYKQEDADSIQTNNSNIPEMRHDVLGLDHKDIMLKILTKMRKSKQAWDQHQQNSLTPRDVTAIPSTTFEQLTKINEKLAQAAANSEKFEAFLAKRKERRNTPERKKFRAADHQIDFNTREQHDFPELLMSTRQRQLFEAEDYLPDEIDVKKT